MPEGEFLTSNTLIAYPFRDSESVPESLVSVFVDAALDMEDFDASMTRFSRSVADKYTEFQIGDTVFGVDDDEFADGRAFVVVNNGMSSVVLDVARLKSLGSFSADLDARFETSCFFPQYTGVTSIEIFNGGDGTGVPDAIITEDFSVVPGYNSVISAESTTDSELDAVRLEFSPGEGLGRVPCDNDCEQERTSIGSPLPSKDGHSLITGDGCYEITQKNDTITIHGKCVACCQCQDYMDKVNDLYDIATRVYDLRDRVVDVHEGSYYGLIDLFELKHGTSPQIDVQFSIVPDADMAALAANDSIVNYAADPGYFKITCKVTNVSGVPCYITVPDRWQKGDSEISFGQTRNGIYIEMVDSGGPGKSSVLNPSRYCVRSRTETQAVYNKKTGEYVKPEIILQSEPGYYDRLDLASVSAKLMNRALVDLTSGKPLSSKDMFSETSKLYDDYGYLLGAGQSFCVSAMYSVPGDTVASSRGIKVWFLAAAYAPMMMYASAYNRARPVTNVTLNDDDKYDIVTEFTLDKQYGIGYTEEEAKKVSRNIVDILFFDFTNGKETRVTASNI